MQDKAGASGRTTAANLGTTTPSTDVSVLPARAFTIQPAPSADSTGSRTHSAGDASAPSASGTPKGSGPDNTAAHGRKSAGRHPSKGAETGEGNWRVPSEKERPWDRPEDKSKLLVFYSDHYEVVRPTLTFHTLLSYKLEFVQLPVKFKLRAHAPAEKVGCVLLYFSC